MEGIKGCFIHPTSCVEEGAIIGEGTRIWHFSHVMAGAQIGQGCSLGQNVFIASTARLGDGVKVQNNVSIYDGVILEDDVFCGPSAVFTNIKNPRSSYPRKDHYQQTLVKRGATIGANATIMCGLVIGSYAFIGAGSVVTSDVPDYGMAYGNPAKLHGWACECGLKLNFVNNQALCQECGKEYGINGGVVFRAR